MKIWSIHFSFPVNTTSRSKLSSITAVRWARPAWSRNRSVIPEGKVLGCESTFCSALLVREMSQLPEETSIYQRVVHSHVARRQHYSTWRYLGTIHVEVKKGEHWVKRWGCLFTCLTVRDLLVEVAHSLTEYRLHDLCTEIHKPFRVP